MIENPTKKMKQLLDDRATSKITQQEFDSECAYWYLDCFDEIQVKPLPSIPSRLQDYYTTDKAMQQRTAKEFWLLPEIKNYFDQKILITNFNKDTLLKLKEFMQYIPESDSVGRAKYREKIIQFEYA